MSLKSETKLVIGMVGLPARGKTFISRKITRFLTWQGIKAKCFNIGNYRRVIVGNHPDENFFSPDNADAVKKRDECAALALEDLVNYLFNEGDIAIYDGTNTPKSRRLWVRNFLNEKLKDYKLIWVESICDENDTIEKNIKQAKVNNPDFIGVVQEEVINDFKKRIDNYSKVYDPTSKDDYKEMKFIKIINLGKKIKLLNIEGYLETKIASYLINLYPYPRPIYLLKNAFTNNREEKRRGGDEELNEKGQRYAFYVNKFFQREIELEPEFKCAEPPNILCSTLKRSIETAKIIDLGVEPIILKNLDQIDFGLWDSMTENEMEKNNSELYEERNKESYWFRYPRGESYSDLVQRTIPVIFEIERSKSPVIIVAHQSTLRCIYSYFTKNEIKDIPFIDIPENTIIKLVPEVYLCNEIRYAFNLQTGKFSETESTNVLNLSPVIKSGIKKKEMNLDKFKL